jgi:hypothetical protein
MLRDFGDSLDELVARQKARKSTPAAELAK